MDCYENLVLVSNFASVFLGEKPNWIPAVMFQCFYTFKKKIPGMDQWFISPHNEKFSNQDRDHFASTIA